MKFVHETKATATFSKLSEHLQRGGGRLRWPAADPRNALEMLSNELVYQGHGNIFKAV